MSLVNQLQASAESDDALTVLRKAKRLSSKLRRQDMKQWIAHELQGYPDDVEVPTYRMIPSKFIYKTFRPMPVGGGLAQSGVDDLPGGFPTVDFPFRDALGACLASVEGVRKNSSNICVGVQGDAAEKIWDVLATLGNTLLRNYAHVYQQLDTSSLENIPERVKDAVLDWACSLEEAGVHGEGQSFSNVEMRDARSVNPPGVNVTIYGSFNGSLQAGNADSTQVSERANRGQPG